MDYYNLCRECGGYVGVTAWEDAGGYCARCAAGIRPGVPCVKAPDPDPVDDSNDPIRDAIDKAARDWADDDQSKTSAETKH